MDGCWHLYPALVFPLLLHVPILYNLSQDPSFAPVLTHMQLPREQGYMRAKVAFPCPWKAGISKNNAVSDLISTLTDNSLHIHAKVGQFISLRQTFDSLD